MGTGGQLYRSTSRRDAKLVIEAMPLDRVTGLLDVELVTWFDRGASEAYAEALHNHEDAADVERLTRIPGLVAEDVEATGLREFVTYDDAGAVAGLAYERIGVAWIPLLRDVIRRLDTLERKD